MNRSKREKVNTSVALLNQIITVICGFILPRYYLKNYGSEVYGLISSISQFLGFVTLMELGMGAVVQSSLYKPLAEMDEDQVSRIIASSDKFFKKIAFILLGYTVFLAVFYPKFTSSSFDWWFEASLVLIISVSSFAEYFFGITYRLLLLADQKAFITHSLASVSVIANLALCVLLMNAGLPIYIVKLASSTVLLLRPLGQYIYVNKKYHINKRIKYEGEPIQQKWNGIAQHIAYYITNNTDTIILTLFSTLQNVSIYSVYNMVTNGFRQLILTLNSGTGALYGEMIARREQQALLKHFLRYEIIIHSIVVLVFSCTGRLIIPFIFVYTKGITDINYIQPLFAFLLTVANAFYCLRLPYNTLIGASGHYKQTQSSAIIEMILNLGISIILVNSFGLIGVAIGTLVALLYRTIYLAWYAKKIIVGYRFEMFIRNISIDIICVILIIFFTGFLPTNIVDYKSWLILAIESSIISVIIVIIINLAFNGSQIMPIIDRIKKIFL